MIAEYRWKYKDIIERLKERIQLIPQGERLPSVRTMMTEYSLSQGVLDKVLTALENDGLIKRVKGSGIYANPKPLRVSTQVIGIVVSDIADSFVGLFLKGLGTVLSENNYNLIICSNHQELQNEIEQIQAIKGKIDALVVFPTSIHAFNPEYQKSMNEIVKRYNIPTLGVDIPIRGISSSLASMDNFDVSAKLATMLAQANPQGMVIYLGKMSSEINIERMHGFNHGLVQGNFSGEICYLNVDSGNVNFTQLLAPLLATHKHRQVVIYNAYFPSLKSIIKLFTQSKLHTPEDIIIASVVDEDLTDWLLTPVITLVKPCEELGRQAANLLLDALRNSKSINSISLPIKIHIPPELKSYFKGING